MSQQPTKLKELYLHWELQDLPHVHWRYSMLETRDIAHYPYYRIRIGIGIGIGLMESIPISIPPISTPEKPAIQLSYLSVYNSSVIRTSEEAFPRSSDLVCHTAATHNQEN